MRLVHDILHEINPALSPNHETVFINIELFLMMREYLVTDNSRTNEEEASWLLQKEE